MSSALPAQEAGRVRITGSVLDIDGRPAPDVSVSLSPVMDDYGAYVHWLDGRRMWAEPDAVVITGDDGRYAFEAAAGTRWRLLVERRERATLTRRLEPLYANREMEPVQLRPGRTLEVEIVSPDGRPVVGARMIGHSEIAGEGEWHDSWSAATTDSAGRAQLPVSYPGPFQVQVAADGLAAVKVRRRNTDLRIVLHAGSRLDLRLRRAGSAPAAGAVIFIPFEGVTLARADSDGLATLYGEPGTSQTIRALTSDGWAVETLVEFPEAEANATAQQTVDLAPPRTLDIEVTRAGTNDPIAGAVTWLQDDRTVAGDAMGRSRLLIPIYQSQVTLHASAEGHLAWRSRRRDAGRVLGKPWYVGLAPTSTLAGRVVDDSGQPLEGVAIDVAAGRNPRGSGQRRTLLEGRDALTGPDGGFVLADVPTGQRLRLEARKDGLAASHQFLEPLTPNQRSSGIEVVMMASRRATGLVTDQSDQPVARASVELHTWRSGDIEALEELGDWLVASATTDGSGRFVLDNLGSEPYQLEVRAAGFLPTSIQGFEIADTEGQADLDLGILRLGAGHQISGRVIDGEGTPIVGVSVGISTPKGGKIDGREASSKVTSATDGSFLFATLAAGSYELQAQHDGWVPFRSGRIDVPQETPTELLLSRGTALSGLVLGTDGQPIPGAKVRSRQRRGGHQRQETTTDERGRFRLQALSPAEHDVAVRAKGYRSESVRVQLVPSSQHEPIEISLAVTSTLTGRVTWPDGRPIGEVSLSARSAHSEDRLAYGQSNHQGVFEIDEVPLGPVVVKAEIGATEVDEEIDIVAGRNRLDLVLPAGVTVSGWAIDTADEPVAGALVFIRGPRRDEHFTGTDGSFRFDDLLPGSYRLYADHPDFAKLPSAVTFEVAAEPVKDLEIRLHRGAEITGRVAPDLAEPAAVKVSISRVNKSGQKKIGSAEALLDHHGSFKFTHVLPGDYLAEARLQLGKEVVAIARFELPEGQDSLDVELQPVDGVELRGRIVSGDEGSSSVEVSLFADSRSTTSTTAADGSFVLRRVPEGPRVLRIKDRFGEVHMRHVDVLQGSEIVVQLPTGEISGLVLDADTREPVGRARVYLEQLDSELRETIWPSRVEREITSDVAGVFSFRSVAAGSYRLRATVEQDSDESVGMAVVDVTSVPLRDVYLAIERNHSLTLRLPPTDEPGGDLVRYLIIDDAGRTEVFGRQGFGHEGLVVLDSMPSGSWTLWLATTTSAWQRFDVQLPGVDEIPITLNAGAKVRFRIPPRTTENGEMLVDLHDADGRHLPHLPGGLIGAQLLEDQGLLSGLWPGQWTLEIREKGGRSWRAAFNVLAGESVMVALE